MNFKNNTNNKRVAIPSKFCCNQSTNSLTIPNATIAKTNNKTENNNFESKNLNQNLTTPVQILNTQQAKPTSFNKQIKETNETNGQNKLSVTCLNKSKTLSNSENTDERINSNKTISKEIINNSVPVKPETPKEKKHHSSYFERITIKKNAKMINKFDLQNGYEINEEQIAVFEETFQILDKDSNGYITLQEIKEVMNSLGYWPTDDNIKQKIKAIDSDNSGTVDFQEFICMMATFRKLKTPVELDQELRDVFKLFDKNGDGFIDEYELKDVLIRLGENITLDDARDMIREADIDGDSKVSFTEFRSILSENKPSIK